MIETKKLTKSQQGFLAAIRLKHNSAFQQEINRATVDVIEELGLSDLVKTKGATLQLAADYSAITVIKPDAPKAKIPSTRKK